jgi:hypothetical protein
MPLWKVGGGHSNKDDNANNRNDNHNHDDGKDKFNNNLVFLHNNQPCGQSHSWSRDGRGDFNDNDKDDYKNDHTDDDNGNNADDAVVGAFLARGGLSLPTSYSQVFFYNDVNNCHSKMVVGELVVVGCQVLLWLQFVW